MKLETYSLGIGDRFGREGAAQLRAFQKAEARGATVVPVWNKSHREHSIIGTRPEDVRREADAATRAADWRHGYHVDADHIGMTTVDAFVPSSDFFTLDVADLIGKPAPGVELAAFVDDMTPFTGTLRIPGLPPVDVTDAMLVQIARDYLYAVSEAGRTYRHIAAAKGPDRFITEVSADETTTPQSPLALFFILGALARERVPLQTIAPRFSGKFLKGVDYVGDVATFERELVADLAVVRHAIDVFGLPPSLKLSIHTGSDKFSLYPAIRRAIRACGAGLHVKTAGTTWLEEVIGLAQSGPRGLAIAKHIYVHAHARFDELCRPYATVVEIDRARLPPPAVVEGWSGDQLVRQLRHDPSCPDYNRDLRQLVHVSFRIAAELGPAFDAALDDAREIIGTCVTDNLFDRHLRPLFVDP